MPIDYLDFLKRLAAKQQDTLRTALSISDLHVSPYPLSSRVLPYAANRLSTGSLDERYSEDIQIVTRQVECFFHAAGADEGIDDEKYELVYTAIQSLYAAFYWGNPLTSTMHPAEPDYIDNGGVVLMNDTGLTRFADADHIGVRFVFQAELFNT